MHACIHEESNCYGITILPVEANQSDFWSEGKEPEVACDGSEGRSQFPLRVTNALSSRGADPLMGMHLKGNRACTNDLASFSSGEAWRIGVEDAASLAPTLVAWSFSQLRPALDRSSDCMIF
jgi:hypothetical protein